MIESRNCSRCGVALPADSPGGHCLPCLLQLGLAGDGSSVLEDTLPTPSDATALPAERAGDRIGRYKVLQQIGEGGCGVVYMAEQDEPVRRRVALKIIKLGMDTRQVIARFEAERQALAMMDHPNIAKVLDAGATPTGRPYFVMELVRGVRITSYCDQQKLSTRQRLDLFIQLCRAVQHAHQKGIIHRDLKPSNILVTEQDGAPMPKIIDFGIAKATTDQRLTDKTLFTAFEQFIGTPAYMSPEQAGLGGLDIDTRSDIYSLGVLLYELLTGKPPFDSEKLAHSALDEILRTIRETEPPRPSARLTTLTEQELTTVAQRRQTEAAKLPGLVRGDLDWIVMKALDKDRRRRYETASGLARDLERYLGNEPVVARPPTATYRLKKLVRRNKVAFAAGAVILITLVLAVVMSTWQAVLATHARADAQTAAQEAQQARISEANQRQKAIVARDAAQEQEMRARERLYVANIALANEALQRSHLGRARELVQKAAEAGTITAPNGEPDSPRNKDLRGWEWRYLWAQTRGDDLFILGKHEPLAQVALWMSDGVRAVSGGNDGLVKLWNVDEHRLLQQLNYPDRVNGLAISPDGTRLAIGVADGVLSLRDAATLEEAWRVKLPHGIGYIVYSPDGEMIAAGGGNRISIVWAKDGSLRRRVGDGDGHGVGDWKPGITFAPDSQSVVSGGGALWILNLQDGTEQWLPTPGNGEITTLAFSRDGRALVSGQGLDLIVWDWPSKRVQRVLRSHRQNVICAAFSPDGTLLASTGHDQTIKLWDTRAWAEIGSLRGHDFEIWSVAFSPDGKRLISASKDDTVRIWPTTVQRRFLELPLPQNELVLTLGTNAMLMALNGSTAGFTLADLFTGKIILQETLRRCSLIQRSAVALAAGQIVFGFANGHVELWDLHSQNKVWSVTNQTVAVRKLASSTTTGQIAVAYEDGRIDLLQPDNGAVTKSMQSGPGSLRSLEFSRNGKRLLVAQDGGGVGNQGRAKLQVWNLESGQTKRVESKYRENYFLSATLSDDGEWVVTTSFDALASLVEVESDREIFRFTGQVTGFGSAAVSPNRTRVALGSNSSGELSVWDPLTGQRLLTLPDQDGGLTSNDANSCSVVGWDANADDLAALIGGKLYVWHAPSLAEIDTARSGQPIQGTARKTDPAKWFRKAAENDDAEALSNLAWLLATCEAETVRNGAEAVKLAERAIEKSGRKDPRFLNTLAAAYAEVKQYDQAVAVQKEAIALLGTEPERREYSSRLKRYESGFPYREHQSMVEADAALREALRTTHQGLARKDPKAVDTLARLAYELADAGKWTEVKPLIGECRALAEEYIAAGEKSLRNLALSGALASLAQVLRNQEMYADGEAISRYALALTDKENPIYFARLNDVALSLQAQDKLAEAEVMFEEALAAYSRAPRHGQDLAILLGNLGDALTGQGKVAEGKVKYAESRAAQKVAWARASESGDPKAQNSLAWGMATSLEPSQRDGKKAVELAKKSVAASKRTNPLTLDTLAAAYAESGQFTDAVAVQKEAIALLKDGPDKKDCERRLKLYTLHRPCRDIGDNDLVRQAQTLLQHRKFAEAETMLREALDALEAESRQEANPEVVSALNYPRRKAELGLILADIYEDLGDYAKAEEWMRHALELQKSAFGDESVPVANLLHRLTWMLLEQGKRTKLAEAEQLARAAVAMKRKLLGAEAVSTANSLGLVAMAAARKGDLAEAETIEREVVRILDTTRGPANPSTLTALNNLAITLTDQGKHAEAEEVLRRSWNARTNQNRQVSAGDLRVLGNLAGVLNGQGKWAEAEAALTNLIALQRKMLSGTHPDVLARMNQLANVMRQQNRLPESLSIYRQVLTLVQKAHGSNSLEVLGVRRACANVLRDQRNWPEAEVEWREALRLIRQLDPDDTLGLGETDVLRDLVATLKRQGKLSEAEKASQEALRLQATLISNAATNQTEQVRQLRKRAEFFTRFGRWNEAVADVKRAIELKPSDDESTHQLPPLLLQSGDLPAYGKHCRGQLEQFSKTDKPGIAYRVAKDSLMVPIPGIDLNAAASLADLAVRLGRRPRDEFVKSLADYRQGHYRESAERLEKLLAQARRDLHVDIQARVVLAMGYQHLGRTDEAQAALTNAVAVADKRLPKLDEPELGDDPPNCVWAYALFKEATALLQQNSQSAPTK